MLTQSDLSRLKLSRGEPLSPAAGRSRVRRLLRPALAALLLAAAGAWGWRWLANAPTEVDEATVTTAYPYQSLAVLTSTGYVVAQRKAAVASKATGRLEWLGVAEGSRVRRGEVIARLESADVSAARDQAAAALKVAQANVEQGRVEALDARRALARASELLERRFVSESVHDQAQARVDKAAAGVRSQEASVAVARANLRAAEVSLEQTLIRAPFDGVVLTKSADVGDVVTPFSSAIDAKGAVVTMADMTTLEVEADVSESNLARVRPGQPVEIVVSRTVPTVDRSKATVMTKIRFVDTDARILPEMSAKAIFLEREVSDAERSPRTAVQAAALTKRAGADVAFVVVDGRARVRTVRTGVIMADLVEVVAGLSPGDKVVLRPGPRLVDGAAVKPAQR
jgi:RND family efflux transporter MFP subunit